jgi:hypothetical protein
MHVSIHLYTYTYMAAEMELGVLVGAMVPPNDKKKKLKQIYIYIRYFLLIGPFLNFFWP